MVAVAKTLIIVNCCTIQHTLSSARVKITVCIRWIRYGQLFWWTNWEKSNETAATTHFLTIQVAEMDEYEKYKPFITASIQYSTISLVSVIRRAVVVVVVIIIITNIRSDGSSWERWSWWQQAGRSIFCVYYFLIVCTRVAYRFRWPWRAKFNSFESRLRYKSAIFVVLYDFVCRALPFFLVWRSIDSSSRT